MLNVLKTIANVCSVASVALMGLEFGPSWLVPVAFGLKAVADGLKSFSEAQNGV